MIIFYLNTPLYVGVCFCVVLLLINMSILCLQESIMAAPCDSCNKPYLLTAVQQGHNDCLHILVKKESVWRRNQKRFAKH